MDSLQNLVKFLEANQPGLNHDQVKLVKLERFIDRMRLPSRTIGRLNLVEGVFPNLAIAYRLH